MIGNTNAVENKISNFIKSLSNKYLAIEYLESDGMSYIDTELKSHSNMSCELLFEFTTVPNDGCLIGARHTSLQQGEGKSRLYFYHYYQSHKLGYGMYLGSGTALSNKIYKVKTRLDQGHLYMYINDSLIYQGFDNYYINNEETFYIFALNDGNIPVTSDEVLLSRAITFYTKAKLYYCKIWDEKTLVRYYIPVKRLEDDVLGLFDLINQEFYTNQGSGNFIGGPDIDLIISNNNII